MTVMGTERKLEGVHVMSAAVRKADIPSCVT